MAKNSDAGKKKPSRDTNGKFAKKPENPDCEPATKGYVKCIARTVISKHKHYQSSSRKDGTEIGFLLFAAVWLFSGLFSLNAALPTHYFEQISWLSGFAAIIMVFVNIDVSGIGSNYTHNGESDIKAIQKYEPPKCESPKRDCEE